MGKKLCKKKSVKVKNARYHCRKCDLRAAKKKDLCKPGAL